MNHSADEGKSATMRQLLYLTSGMLFLDGATALFAVLDWGYGLARAGLLLAVAAGLFVIGTAPVDPGRGRVGPIVLKLVCATAIVLALLDAGFMAESLYHTATTGEIRLDQGQDTYRAAAGLLKGENPYGRGALLDISSYTELVAGAPSSRVHGILDEYWRTQSPALRRTLLHDARNAVPAGGRATPLGYKYGPVIVLATAMLVPLFGPLAVPVADISVVIVLLATLWFVLRGVGVDRTCAIIALCGVMGDFQIIKNFIVYSATDIWALMFGFLAVFAASRGSRLAPAFLVALAMASKIFPGVLFLPLLFLRFSWRAFATLCATYAITALPWLAMDARDYLLNAVLWGGQMGSDATSWTYYVPSGVILPAKVAFGCGAIAAAWLAVRAMNRGAAWFWAMGVVAAFAILLGNAFHNNYLPWMSVWSVLAIAQWASPTPAGGPASS